jgi:hypothetical protein
MKYECQILSCMRYSTHNSPLCKQGMGLIIVDISILLTYQLLIRNVALNGNFNRIFYQCKNMAKNVTRCFFMWSIIWAQCISHVTGHVKWTFCLRIRNMSDMHCKNLHKKFQLTHTEKVPIWTLPPTNVHHTTSQLCNLSPQKVLHNK